MNFNIYVRKPINDELKKIAKALHRSRNSIVTEAIEEWLEKHQPIQWPKGFFDFKPIDDIPDIKELRKDLRKKIKEDPLA